MKLATNTKLLTVVPFLRWHARQLLEQIGMFGVLGLGLLAFCGMYYFSSLGPQQSEVAQLQRAVLSEQAVAVEPPQSLNQLQAFYDVFPNVEAASDALAKLNEVAVQEGVLLEQGEYTWGRSEEDSLVRYGVLLPIRGDYIRLRKFLSRALGEIPNISLDSVEFQRQKISEAALDARVRMTLFMVDK